MIFSVYNILYMKLKWFSVCICLAFATPIVASAAFSLPPNDGYLTDDASLIDATQEQVIESALSGLADQTGQFIVVFFIESLLGYDVDDITDQVREEWDLPSNSVLLLFSYSDRIANVSTDFQLSTIFSDQVRNGIVEKDIMPSVREGKYNKAILSGVESIMNHITGKYTEERYYTGLESSKSLAVTLLYAIVFLFALSWLLGTIAIFTFNRRYSIAGTLIGPIVGVILLQKHGMWLSIPPFLLLGVLSDYFVFKLYKSCVPKRRRKRSK